MKAKKRMLTLKEAKFLKELYEKGSITIKSPKTGQPLFTVIVHDRSKEKEVDNIISQTIVNSATQSKKD
ncbi:MAG: hypothetical protein WC223_11045 [Bacteroidales bacterium]|jgi:hypothetical protein